MSQKLALIAEALLDGADCDSIRAQLIASGVSPSAADYELSRADKNPLFAAAQTLNRRLAKRDWALGIHGKLAATRADGGGIATVDRIEPQRFFADHYVPNWPVKLTGLVDHWPALGRWTLDYLDEVAGDAVVELQGQRECADDYELAKDRHRRQLPLRAVTAAIREYDRTNEFYVTAYNDTINKAALARLWDDLGPVALLRAESARDGFFWLGPRGTLTPFHHDLTNNLLVQVMGRKRVHLVPSWEVGRMRNAVHCFSERSPDELRALDDAQRPPMLTCEIGPGEALFLPVGWWHHVEALDPSISMSFTNFSADNDFYSDYPRDVRF